MPGFGKCWRQPNGRRVVTMATDKQRGFIRTLLLQVPADVAAAYQADADNADLSAQRASTVIEALLGKKKVARAPNLASDAQVSFLAKLVASRDLLALPCCPVTARWWTRFPGRWHGHQVWRGSPPSSPKSF